MQPHCVPKALSPPRCLATMVLTCSGYRLLAVSEPVTPGNGDVLFFFFFFIFFFFFSSLYLRFWYLRFGTPSVSAPCGSSVISQQDARGSKAGLGRCFAQTDCGRLETLQGAACQNNSLLFFFFLLMPILPVCFSLTSCAGRKRTSMFYFLRKIVAADLPS